MEPYPTPNTQHPTPNTWDADDVGHAARIRPGNWAPTYSGVQFFHLDPRPEEINIKDIAHALSNLCRFCGHTRAFFSVAQHSVIVSHACAPEDALWGLLHDAAEAYINDVPKPVKQLVKLTGYNQIEERIMRAVATRFELPALPLPESVHIADRRALFAERRDLMTQTPFWTDLDAEPLPEPVVPWSPRGAERIFLQRFYDLTRGGHA